MIKLDDNWSLEIYKKDMHLIIHSTCIKFIQERADERPWYGRSRPPGCVSCMAGPSDDVLNKAKFIAGKKLYIG